MARGSGVVLGWQRFHRSVDQPVIGATGFASRLDGPTVQTDGREKDFSYSFFVDGVWETLDQELRRVLFGEPEQISQSRGLIGGDVSVHIFPVARETTDGESALGLDDAEALRAQCASCVQCLCQGGLEGEVDYSRRVVLASHCLYEDSVVACAAENFKIHPFCAEDEGVQALPFLILGAPGALASGCPHCASFVKFICADRRCV